MSAKFFNPRPQFFDSTPTPLSGAKLFSYEAGTTTKLNTYSDEDLSVANSNPIVLNSSGYPDTSIFLLDQAYKFVLAPSTDSDPPTSPIWTEDNYYGTDLQSVAEKKVGSGAPTGNVAGTAASSGVLATEYWDYTNLIEYRCSVTGDAASAEWTALNASAATPSVPPPQGYLTLVTGTPVITSDQAAKTAVFYTPDRGNLIPIYNGSNFTPTEFSELTLTLVSSHVASTLYDIFVWSESGVITIGTGPAWSTSTAGSGARGSGASTTELTRINGLLVNAVSMTTRNSSTTYTVAANLGTYVGSIFMDGTNGQVTCHRSFGQDRKWGIWNAYNRRPITLLAGDATASWTYGTDTLRASNDDSSNSATIFAGLAEEEFRCAFAQNASSSGIDVTAMKIGIGHDSTSSASGFRPAQGVKQSSGVLEEWEGYARAEYTAVPQLGISVITCLEAVEVDSGNLTFLGGQEDMQLTVRWMS